MRGGWGGGGTKKFLGGHYQYGGWGGGGTKKFKGGNYQYGGNPHKRGWQ